jgi:TPR repeat protein
MAAGATLLAQGSDRGIRVLAPVGRGGERIELYSGSYALIVGVNQYDARGIWPSLDSVPREIADVEAVLREMGFSTERLVNPTGDQLRSAVPDFIRKYGYNANARLLFFFAGHGYTLDGGERGYFLPRDTPDPKLDEPGFRRIAVSMQLVSTWATDLTAKHALFVFDSCFSGSIFRTRSTPALERISAMTARPVREFIAAGSAFETVPARSIFTPVFVRGLRGAADLDRDGFVTGTELGNYVQGEVIAYAKGGQTPQFGKIRDPQFDQGDFVFAVPAPPPIAAGADPAVLYRDGMERYNAKDYAGAFPFLMRAGNAGQLEATFYVGWMFDNGLGVATDWAAAREWYQKAAAAGSSSAMNNLGTMYATGRGVVKDASTATAWYRKAAENGSLYGMTNYAGSVIDGIGTTADRPLALSWYKRAAFRGHEPAVKELQREGEQSAVQWATANPDQALKTGIERFDKGQHAESFDPILRAALSGKTQAMFYLGYLYSTGVGTPQDRVEARYWYEQSANAGVVGAMNNLGFLYDVGAGVPQNYAVAREWYLKAANGGYAAAMWNLGLMYEYGTGVTKSIPAALDWYRKAAALKYEDAIKAVARLDPTGAPAPPATRGGGAPAAAAPITFEFDSFMASGAAGTQYGAQGTLTVRPDRINFGERQAARGGVPIGFSASCAEIVVVRTDTEDDGSIALRFELKGVTPKGQTFKLFSTLNARRALTTVLDACKPR